MKTLIDSEPNVSPLISPHTHYRHNHTIGAGELIMRGCFTTTTVRACVHMCVCVRVNFSVLMTVFI